MANFDLSSLALKSVCPNNEIFVDDADLPSVMVYIPKFKNSDVLTGGNDSTHPAFIVNGQEIDGFWYSKYQNVVHTTQLTGGSIAAAYSLPCEDPTANITFDTARSRCEAKGAGWHLSTNAEWAAIALWCKKNGFMPYGNNNYGKDTRESNYKAIPTYKDGSTGQTCRVATGTGPLTWSHDKTLSGIWDLNGNVWEWQGGIRLVWGELQILANNDAADPDNPQNTTSVCWKAINAADGSLVEPEREVGDSSATLSGNTVKLDYVSGAWQWTTTVASSQDASRSCAFGKVTAAAAVGEAAKILLRSLALLPDEGAQEADYESDYFSWNNGVAERCVCRGGPWSDGAHAGVFSLHGPYSRSNVATYVGFRSAFIRYSDKSDNLEIWLRGGPPKPPLYHNKEKQHGQPTAPAAYRPIHDPGGRAHQQHAKTGKIRVPQAHDRRFHGHAGALH